MEKKEMIDNVEEKTFNEKRRRPFYKNRRKFKRKFHVEVKYFYDGEDKEQFMPEYKTSPAAGCDIRNAGPDLVLKPGDFAPLVPSGIGIKIPLGFEAQVRPRSGLAIKHGITVINSPGTVDADYRGEICVELVNLSNTPFTVEPGERIAQLVFSKYEQTELIEVEELDNTERGEGAFGHTGNK